MKTYGKREAKKMDKMERAVRKLVSKYAHSVRKCEFEDLCQTIWYLVISSKKTYDPSKGKSPESYAYYFADMKLKDHFGRRVNLPGTSGVFSLLQFKADMIDDTENLPDLSQDENFMDDVAENIENEKTEYADETFEAPD
jgi:DNA-directed RNA polymerase specialized sigma subunit